MSTVPPSGIAPSIVSAVEAATMRRGLRESDVSWVTVVQSADSGKALSLTGASPARQDALSSDAAA